MNPLRTLLTLAALPLAVGPGADKEEPKSDQSAKPEPDEPPKLPDEPPVVTRHKLRIGERTLQYQVTTGMMPLKNDKGETEARLFFMAYTLDGQEGDKRRPLMFSFNGGPGSSSVWLHLGALGPRRVKMLDDGGMPAPPFTLVDNEQTWLEATDLVFIDPVETGYSRAQTPELTKQFHEVKRDIESVGEFIRLYLTRYGRWGSPLFLVGESYGTFRAAGLAGHLVERGIAFNGIVLVSSILNLQTGYFGPGNDLPYILYLPSYTATAWYHQRLPADLQGQPLADVLTAAATWATTEYLTALAKGDALTAEERQATIAQLARLTGLGERFLDLADLRIELGLFCKELLRDQRRTVGRLDSRYTGLDAVGVGERPDFDPSLAAIRPPFTATLNDYVRNELGYETDDEYHILRGLEWDWSDAGPRVPDTSEALRGAFAKNRYLRLFVASGYYDMATPYFATEYTLKHMGLDPSLHGNVRVEEYKVGHMVYLEINALAQLKTDVTGFIAEAIMRAES